MARSQLNEAMNIDLRVEDALVSDGTAIRSIPSRVRLFLVAIVIGICVAGFWNARVVDGFGSDIVANATIGGAAGKASEFGTLGAGFGFLFALVAGLAATFTACNCVAFAMIPMIAAFVVGCAKNARVTGEQRRVSPDSRPRSIAAHSSIAIPSTLNTTPACAKRISRALKAAAPTGPSQPMNVP
jgi:hypothetical protein